MPVWRPSSVDATPELVVRSWMLIRTGCNDVHIVGYNVTEGEGRVSSPLKMFDPATRTAVTRSGRRYVLRESPGMNLNAQYTFAAWCEIFRMTSWTDVTAEILVQGLPKT